MYPEPGRSSRLSFEFVKPENSLAVQRDIFVFQCLIGCRVGDLYKLTKSNVINEGIEYIPRKTKDGRPVTVRVPLNSIAKEILAKYKHLPFDELLPMISQQKYKVAKKEAVPLPATARLTRIQTVRLSRCWSRSIIGMYNFNYI